MTVAELNAFVVNAASQEIDFLCTGRVVRVDTDNGWCYVACSKWSKKLQHTASAFACGRCNNSHSVGVFRYLEVAIADDTAEGTFFWFDGVMTKLHSLRSSEAVQSLDTSIVDELGPVLVDDADDNGGNNEDDDNMPPGKPSPDEYESGRATGNVHQQMLSRVRPVLRVRRRAAHSRSWSRRRALLHMYQQ
ncbi:hypothetical protein Bca4012_025114 [Brassica carinata]